MFECRPYSVDKPKNCYQVISDQVIGAITQWIQQYPPTPSVADIARNPVEPVESKMNEQETVAVDAVVETVDTEEVPESTELQSVDVEEVPNSEDMKQTEVVVQNMDDIAEQVQNEEMIEEAQETNVVEEETVVQPPSVIGI